MGHGSMHRHLHTFSRPQIVHPAHIMVPSVYFSSLTSAKHAGACGCLATINEGFSAHQDKKYRKQDCDGMETHLLIIAILIIRETCVHIKCVCAEAPIQY